MRDKIIILFSFCAFILLFFRSASAQSLDIVGPSIFYQPSTAATHVGQVLQVEAVITDNEAIKEAVLFFRPTGKEGYLSLVMTLQARGSNLYSTTIPKALVIEPKMEFYIQASDTSGNTTFQGSSSTPLVVTIFPPQLLPQPQEDKSQITVPDTTKKPPEIPKVPPIKADEERQEPSPSVVVQPQPKPTPKPVPVVKPFYKKGWFWGVVGVVVGGLLLDVSGGDEPASADAGSGTSPAGGGSITFVVPSP